MPPVSRFLRFCIVGGFGFALDTTGVILLVRAGMDPYLARAVIYPLAITATWGLNRAWSFADRASPRKGREYAAYIGVQAAGAAANYAAYALMLALWPTLIDLLIVPLVAGAAAGLAVNYAGALLLVFTRRTAPATADT